MYHGFGTRPPGADPFNLFVPVRDFEAHLMAIRRYLRPLDLDRFLAGLRTGRWPPRSVLVTMDDGYASVLTEAAPRLHAAGVPAVAFVCPGRFGGESAWMEETAGEPLLTADEVARLPELGVEVGVHSMDHTRLPGVDDEELQHARLPADLPDQAAPGLRGPGTPVEGPPPAPARGGPSRRAAPGYGRGRGTSRRDRRPLRHPAALLRSFRASANGTRAATSSGRRRRRARTRGRDR